MMRMPDDPEAEWPGFAMVEFSTPTGIPFGWDEPLVRRGAPKDLLGGVYRAVSALTVLEDARFGPLVRFGESGLFGSVCLDPQTGEVVVIYAPDGPAWRVNASLEQFIASVQAVIERFPFYERDGDLDEREQVIGELERALRAIDPTALTGRDGFWWTFLDDVMIGDYASD